MGKTALVIIDLQNDFCPGGSFPVHGGDSIVTGINHLASRFSATGFPIIATQDWHPRGHVSFASAQNLPPFSVDPAGTGTLWPDHCVMGSKGAELHPALEQRYIALIVRKGTRRGMDSYSAFRENDHTTSTGLGGYLKDLDVTTIVFAGLAFDYCVGWSARDAVGLGFRAVIVRDLTRAIDQPAGSADETGRELIAAGVGILAAADIELDAGVRL